MARDPVCAMTVREDAGKPELVHEGTKYFFCGPGCKAKFTLDPANYLAASIALSAGVGVAATHAPPSPLLKKVETP